MELAIEPQHGDAMDRRPQGEGDRVGLGVGATRATLDALQKLRIDGRGRLHEFGASRSRGAFVGIHQAEQGGVFTGPGDVADPEGVQAFERGGGGLRTASAIASICMRKPAAETAASSASLSAKWW